MNDSFEQSIIDFKEDILWLIYLLDDRKKLLEDRHSTVQSEMIFNVLIEQLNQLYRSINETSTIVDECHSLEQQIQISERIYEHFLHIRSIYSQVSAYALSTDWQSPSFHGSLFQEAGSQEGTIQQSINDYKRDQHRDQHIYEKTFKREYIHHSFINTIHVYTTNTGMSALTTVIGFLIGEHAVQRTNILVGSHSYFENKLLLKKLFTDSYTEHDETHMSEFLFSIKRLKPQAIFLDSLCNNSNIIIPNIYTMIQEIKKIKEYHPFIIIDNTCSAIKFQTLQQIFPIVKNIIVWESLLKYHQFGIERTTGGIIYASCNKGIELYTYRDHLGTNITDQQILSLPLPNRIILEQRLDRHARNNQLLSHHLQSWVASHHNSSIDKVISAALIKNDNHNSPLYPGSFLTFQFKERYQQLSYYNQLLKTMMNIAKHEHVPLIAGTSFGLPITRIYIPASRKGQGIPFLRVSLGTEQYVQINRLFHVISKSIASCTP